MRTVVIWSNGSLLSQKFFFQSILVVVFMEDTGMSYSFNVSGKSLSSKGTLALHRPDRYSFNVQRCEICAATFTCNDDLKKHMLLHDAILSQYKYQCETCGRVFDNPSILAEHVRLHTERPYTCKLCNLSFGQPFTLRDHMWTHINGKPHPCPSCDKCFKSLSYLNRHMLLHSRSFVCDTCDKAFLTRVALKQHLDVHSTTKNYECDICKKHYKHRTSMSKHMQDHVIGNYKCEICDKELNSKYELNTHKSSHCKERLISCHLCESSYISEAYLKVHIETFHCSTKQKEFTCGSYGKAFKSKKSLKAHIKRHLSGNRFQCNQCYKSYKSKASLRVHIGHHTRGKSANWCWFCDKYFTWNNNLSISHDRTHVCNKHVISFCGVYEW